MSLAKLLPPNALPAENEGSIYPSLPEITNAKNFRLTKISRIEREISAEVEHYRLVLKKYKSPESASLFPGWPWRLHSSFVFWGCRNITHRCWNCCQRTCCRDSPFIWRSFHWPVRCQQEA